MYLDEHYFTYGDFNSKDFNLIFAHVETDRFDGICGNLKVNAFYNKVNGTRYFMGYDTTESPLSLEVEIVTDDASTLSMQDCKTIERKLFNCNIFKKLFIDIAEACDDDGYSMQNGEMQKLYLNCVLINPERIISGNGVIGYRCTMECDSGYAAYEVTKRYELDDVYDNPPVNVHQIHVNVDSDIDDYTYPSIIIGTTDAARNIRVQNETALTSEDDYVSFRVMGNMTDYVIGKVNIAMDGNTKMVTTDGEQLDEYTEFNRKFLRLINGDNLITIGGLVEFFEISWVNRRHL